MQCDTFILRCSCGHCRDELLQDAREYRCCKEILECIDKFKFEDKDAECITQHWDSILSLFYVTRKSREIERARSNNQFERSFSSDQLRTLKKFETT
jgi:hypothetical protein